jgi:sialic acid synthase SpsE
VVAGLSDHTLGHDAAVAAVVLGASIIEKHFTLRREDGGPDGAFSMEPQEWQAMTQAIRAVEQALGRVSYGPIPEEQPNLRFRRSLFVVQNVKAGEAFTDANVRIIRPGDGLPPKDIERVIGKRATSDITRGTPLTWDLVKS